MQSEEQTFLYQTTYRTCSQVLVYENGEGRHFHAESAKQQQIGTRISIQVLFSCQMGLLPSIPHMLITKTLSGSSNNTSLKIGAMNKFFDDFS
jgi:hypothetical protein